MSKDKGKSPQSPKAERQAAKAGKRHRYQGGPQRVVVHDRHSIAFWKKHPEDAKCPACGGVHLVPAGEQAW